MPHVSSSGGDDLASSDEVKVYKDEADEENPSSEIAEDKVVLVTETEEGKTSDGSRDGFDRGSKEGQPVNGEVKPHRPIWNPLISPYPYPNGASLTGFNPLSLLQHYHSADRFGSPPPAHMGISAVPIDPKVGWPRPLPIPGQFPHPFYSDLSTAMPWTGPGGYPMPSGGLRGPYPPLSSSPLSRFSPSLFPPHPGLPPGFPHHAAGLVSPGAKQDLAALNPDHPHHPAHRAHEYGLMHGGSSAAAQAAHEERERAKQRIKKPLNAFMLFMKEMRPKVIEECSLKESAAINQILGRKVREFSEEWRNLVVMFLPPNADMQDSKKAPYVKKPLNAFMLFMKEIRPKEYTLKESATINQILGRKWHALDRGEQAKYYEMARKEKELHLQLYPGWSARDNYGTHSKNKKKRKAPGMGGGGGSGSGGSNHGSECGDYKPEYPSQSYTSDSECVNNPKKCRARFGLDQQNQWCKPCRRKKKCIRFLEEGGVYSDEDEDNNNTPRGGVGVPSVSSDPPGSPASSSAQHRSATSSHNTNTTTSLGAGVGASSRRSPAPPPPRASMHIPSAALRSSPFPPPPPHAYAPPLGLYQPYDLFGSSSSKPASSLSRPMPPLGGAPGASLLPPPPPPPHYADSKLFDIRGGNGGAGSEGTRDASSASRDRKPLAPANQTISSVTPNMILAS